MSKYYTGFNHAEWEKAGLKDFGDFAECVTYCNQMEDYADSLQGEWWYADDDTLTIYHGTFGNDHSPGASIYTHAEVYDNDQDYRDQVKEWEAEPEYIDREEYEDDEDEEEDASCNRCQAMMIQGIYCHELGCPNHGKVKIDGEWVRPEEEDDSDY